jgi:hypothetical protein
MENANYHFFFVIHMIHMKWFFAWKCFWSMLELALHAQEKYQQKNKI